MDKEKDSDTGFKPAMSTEDFREWGKKMIDYICDYLDNIGSRNVIPDVEPGYLRPLMPTEAPEDPESWPSILSDVETLIMPGITHWQHPRFHAYFPAGNSFPSIIGDMLSDALGTIGFSWAASPAMAELEIVVLDWLAILLDLPKKFTHEGTGGGSIQGSASDCILLSMLAARYQAIEKYKHDYSHYKKPETQVLSKLVAYCSSLAHSCVEKAGMISFVQVRHLKVDQDFGIDVEALENAIQEDIALGFIPFYVCATIGTTACCSFDDISKVGPIARRHNLWLHIDGAYGANSFICPEFRSRFQGIEYADSLNFNPNKWLLTNFDASVFWVGDKNVLTRSMVVNPVYLQHKFSSKAIDFRHWGIPLSRRFRALKLWFVIRKYGAKGLRAYIRNHVRLAKLFESLVKSDGRFEILGKVELGLVCFRIKGSNTLTQCLLRTINESRELHVVPAVVNDLYIIRFAVCRESASDQDIHYAWNIIKNLAELIIAAEASLREWRVHTRDNSIRKKRRARAAASALRLGENGQESASDIIIPNEQVSILDKVPEDEEGEERAEMETEDEEASESSDSSDIADLDFMEMEDSDIIQLAAERLLDLKELGAKEAYNVLAQQLRNLGVTDVKPYDECELQTTESESTPPREKIEEGKVLKTPEPESEILDEREELARLHNRVGRFKSVSVAIGLRGTDKFTLDGPRRISHEPIFGQSKHVLGDQMTTPNPDSSFLNNTIEPNMEQKFSQDAVSSTPCVAAHEDLLSPRLSIRGPLPPNRRFSFNPGNNSSICGGSGGTPVVARLVSMVMNASGNGPLNTTQTRTNRASIKMNSMLDEIKEAGSGCSHDHSDELNHEDTENTRGKMPTNSWRVGMNQDEDIDDVFVCDSDLCVGSFSKENTLTRLRRQTLLKMISDPISYNKSNRRNFRSLREQRRMTTVVHDFDSQERPRSEYSRRPTVQVCENLHEALVGSGGLDDCSLMRDLKRRNKSMFESSNSSPLSNTNDNTHTGKITRQLATTSRTDLPRKPPNSTQVDEDKIEEEKE